MLWPVVAHRPTIISNRHTIPRARGALSASLSPSAPHAPQKYRGARGTEDFERCCKPDKPVRSAVQGQACSAPQQKAATDKEHDLERYPGKRRALRQEEKQEDPDGALKPAGNRANRVEARDIQANETQIRSPTLREHQKSNSQAQIGQRAKQEKYPREQGPP